MTAPEEAAELVLVDGEAVADLATYVRRARTLEPEGAIRLQAVGSVLAAWTCVLPGAGVPRSGMVLGLRTTGLAGPHRVDVTVPLAALVDRFARRAATGEVGTALPLPPMRVAPPWAGVSPPRGPWEPVGEVEVAALLEAGQAGIAEVAQGVPDGAGAAAVAALRARVWGRPVAPGVSAGVALAVTVLGFAGEGRGSATVHRAGPWSRVSLPAGHVLCR